MRRDIFQAITDSTRRAIIAQQPMTPNAFAEHNAAMHFCPKFFTFATDIHGALLPLFFKLCPILPYSIVIEDVRDKIPDFRLDTLDNERLRCWGLISYS